jgi:hypothetical protein
MGGRAVNPTPARNLRVDTELWERFDEATKLLGTTRSDWLRNAIRWCVGEAGAEAPSRSPSAELGEELSFTNWELDGLIDRAQALVALRRKTGSPLSPLSAKTAELLGNLDAETERVKLLIEGDK